MAVTIRTIADLAHVSTATVSRYFNNPESVSAKKRALLATIIAENDYQPNELARGLIRQTSNMIGVILPDINNIYFSPIMLGIETELEIRGYSTFICNTHGSIEQEKAYISALLSHKVAGVVFIGTRPLDPALSQHIVKLAEKLPVVLTNDFVKNVRVNFVMTDEVKGMGQAVQYLYSLGHRRIALLNGSAPMNTYAYKHTGFTQAALACGIENDVIYLEAEPYETGGHSGMTQLLASSQIPTAVVTANDQMAIGAVRAVFESGRCVPTDISIVGFSNTPISGEIYPRLTTVDQYPSLTGKTAAKLLLAQIVGSEPVASTISLETQLVIRDSCTTPHLVG